MAEKGIIYVMTTAVTGLIKIGRTETHQFEQRMRFLESNGYYNVTGLKRYFAIEVEDYTDKERLIHEIFNKHKVAESELFALDQEIIKQLLLCFEGRSYISQKMLTKKKNLKKLQKRENRANYLVFIKKV